MNKTNMRNNDIRQYAFERGVRLWQVSERYGFAQESSMSKMLRHELSPEIRQRLMDIIDEISAEAAAGEVM